jgi:hypothetical protein
VLETAGVESDDGAADDEGAVSAVAEPERGDVDDVAAFADAVALAVTPA